jgi:hypothetical protein
MLAAPKEGVMTSTDTMIKHWSRASVDRIFMTFYVNMNLSADTMIKHWSRASVDRICREINEDKSLSGGEQFVLLPRKIRRHLARIPKRCGAQVRAILLRSELRKMRDDLLAEFNRRTA